MGDMLAMVAYGTAFEQWDKRLNHRTGRQKVHDTLVPGVDLVDSIKAAAKLFPTDETFSKAHIEHIAEHWFPADDAKGAGTGWFKTPRAQKMETFRSAYRKAIDEATKLGAQRKAWIPIQSYWMCPGIERFESCVLVSDAQVTVLILTPHNQDMHIDLLKAAGNGAHAAHGGAGHDEGVAPAQNLDLTKMAQLREERMWVFGNGPKLRALAEAVHQARNGSAPGEGVVELQVLTKAEPDATRATATSTSQHATPGSQS